MAISDTGTTTQLGGARASKAEYGSDLIVEILADLGIPYLAFNPGSSFRGIHDSLVNFNIPGVPEMVQCCHEEIAIAVAHGYARATGKMIATAIHDLVGLQHASMAIYNAWCDRIPMLVIGGTGPMNTNNRRNHIDWVHTALVQGNVVRDFVKWDDQPTSVSSFPDSIMRAYRLAATEPSAPVYLCFDVDLQEEPITTPMILPDKNRFLPPAPPAPHPEALEKAARLLVGAQWPVILADSVGRQHEAVPLLEQLAELLSAPVVSTGGRFNLANNHPLNLSTAKETALSRADAVLALDVFDLCGALGPGISPDRQEDQFIAPGTRIIHISLWDLLQHSLSSDYERLNPVDIAITADTRVALPLLTDLCRRQIQADSGSIARIDDRRRAIESLQATLAERRQNAVRHGWDSMPITQERLSAELWEVAKQYPWTFVHGGPRGGGWTITEPDQMCGGGRGAGLGQSSGAAVGASLAFKNAGRLCMSLTGDGDMLYAPSSLWTASHMKVPLLTIVNNNRSYGNDEGHQEYLAKVRNRPVENKGVGIYIQDPDTDFVHLAQSFGVEGLGPVTDPSQLHDVLGRAAEIIMKEQRPVLVDVITQRRGMS
ncbi:MAG TPA: thiamine pyrophosphate-binding protein [Dehalococcoidia bacterium]|nr:thiamine pyrophosphate-binding protein [Dehalococcoidia bacterium]